MESKELYRCLPGMNQPWMVERVDLDMERQQIDIYVVHPNGTRFACPDCGQELAVYDHLGERVWRHLDSCQFLTYLHAAPPRVSCPEHGVKQGAPFMGRSEEPFHPPVRYWRSTCCWLPTSSALHRFYASTGIRCGI